MFTSSPKASRGSRRKSYRTFTLGLPGGGPGEGDEAAAEDDARSQASAASNATGRSLRSSTHPSQPPGSPVSVTSTTSTNTARRRERVSTHTPQVSYAYGAPNSGDRGRAAVGASGSPSSADVPRRLSGGQGHDQSDDFSHLHPHDNALGLGPPAANLHDPNPPQPETAAQRYAALKARRANGGTLPLMSAPKPTDSSAANTSVNIASAFNGWTGTGANATRAPVSVGSTSTSRSRGGHNGAASSRNGRAADPLDGDESADPIDLIDVDPPADWEGETTSMRQPLEPATFYVRQRSSLSPHPPAPGEEEDNSKSYDYTEEERYAASLEREAREKPTGQGWSGSWLSFLHSPTSRAEPDYEPSEGGGSARRKKGRTSFDNRTYRPRADEESDDDDVLSDEGRRRRRRKSQPGLGPLPSGRIPDWHKGRKKRKSGGKRNSQGGEGDDEEDVPTDEGASAEFAVSSSLARRGTPKGKSRKVALVDSGVEIPSGVDDYSADTSVDNVAEYDDEPLDEEPDLVGGSLGRLLRSVCLFFYVILTSIFYVIYRLLAVTLHYTLGLPVLLFARMGNMTKTQLSLVNWKRIFNLVGVILLAILVVGLLSQPRDATSLSRTNQLKALLPSIPFFGTPKVWSAPEVPPETLAELVERLTSLEHSMAELALLERDSREKLELSDRSAAGIVKRVAKLEGSIDDVQRRMREADKRLENAQKRDFSRVEQAIEAVKSQFAKLSSQVDEVGAGHRASATNVAKLNAEVDKLQEELANVGSQVVEHAAKVSVTLDAERVASIAVKAIEDYLPSRLAVRMDAKSGEIEIDPAFWTHLRQVFLSREEADLATKPSRGGTPAPPPSWNNFLAANEAALRTWADAELSRKVNSGAVVSRQAFLDVLHREMKTLKTDFETKVNENVQSIGREFLAKAARQEQVHQGGRGASTGSKWHLPGFGGSHEEGDLDVTIKTSDGQNITALISSLVESALRRHAADVVARPDYALYTGGAHIIPSATSPTYAMRPRGIMGSLFGSATGMGVIQGRPPVTALHPDTNVGSCWPFRGETGQLGIALSRRIVVTDITIDHVAKENAYDLTTAPKDFEIWGVLEREEDVHAVERYHQRLAESTSANDASLDSGAGSGEPQLIPIPPRPDHVLLAQFTYDPSDESSVQTFSVRQAVRELGIPMGVVIVKVTSNHGNPEMTCLYRVRVHGEDLIGK